MSDEARRRRQREEVVAPEERLQHDVVERERERGAEHEQRSLRALERELFPGSERDDDGDAEQRDPETRDRRRAESCSRPTATANTSVIAGASATTRARDTGCGVLRTQVQEHVIPDDDDEPGRGDAHGISTSQAR